MLSTFFVAEGTDFSANQIEVEGDENGETEEYDDSDIQLDEDGQITLF